MKIGPLVISKSGVGLVWGKGREPRRGVMVRGFDAAKLDRYSLSFQNGSGSRWGDDILWAKGPALRRVSRHLVRNERTATTLKKKSVLRFAGDTGPIPRFPRGRGMQERWREWARRSDIAKERSWAALIKLWKGEQIEVGDGLMEWRLVGGELLLQPHEPEELTTLGAEFFKGGDNVVRDGVRYDVKTGRKLAWLFQPYTRQYLAGVNDVIEVPAERMLHLYKPTRPSASRGVSLYAQAAILLHDRGDTVLAQLLLQKAAAYLGASVTTEAPATDIFAGLGATDDPASGADEMAALQQVVTLDPSAINFLPKGTSMSILSAKTPDPEFQAFYQVLTNEAAVLFDLSASEVSGDWRNKNFSNSKIEERTNEPAMWDARVEAEDVLHPFIEQWIFVEAMAGRIKAEPADAKALAADTPWSWPAKPYMDPEKELNAINAEVASGLKTWSQACEERGLDPEEQAAAILADEDLAKRYGIILPGTRTPILKPGAVSAAGAEAAADALAGDNSSNEDAA